MRFSLEKLPKQPQGSRLQIPHEMIDDSACIWTRCLVGFFPGARLPFTAVRSIVNRVWKQFGLEQVMTTTNGFMLFRFKEEEGLHTVVERGPWMFGGKSIILQQWHPHFLFDRNKITSLPVWIRLRGLPFPLWNRAGLSLAASMVGRPIACDEHTHFCTRLDYARICVEVEASHSYVHSFEMDTPLSEVPIRVEVEYEWRPTRCKDCQVFGHSCTSIAKATPTVTSEPAIHTLVQTQPNLEEPLPPPQSTITKPTTNHQNTTTLITTTPEPLPLLVSKQGGTPTINQENLTLQPPPKTTMQKPIQKTQPQTLEFRNEIPKFVTHKQNHTLNTQPTHASTSTNSREGLNHLQGSHAKTLAQPTSRAKTATSNQNTTAPIPKHKNILTQNPTTKDIHDQTCQSEESSKNPNTQLICTESRVDPLLSQSIDSGSSNSKEDDAASYATRDPPEDWGDTMESTPPSPKTVKRKKGSKKGKGPKGY